MSTKPTLDDSRWATDETNNTAPSSGQKDTGWTPGQVAVSDYFNVLALEAYKWHQYLSDGYLTGAFGLASAITPSSISGSNDDYAPTGHATTQTIRQDLSAAATLTGLAGPVAGRVVTIINLSGTYDLKLAHDVTSTAANRFSLPGAKDLYLCGAGSYVQLWYDTTLSRWVVRATNGRQPQTLWLHAANFQMSDSTDAYALGADGLLNSSGSAAAMYGPLPLPVGTRLTAITFSVKTGAVDSFHSGSLEYADPAAGGDSVLIGSGSTTVESSDQTFTLSGVPHTMLDFGYSLSMSSIQNGDILVGVKVAYY